MKKLANNMATKAFELSQNEEYLSPFVYNARTCGFKRYEERYKDKLGGKKDDITVVIGKVNLKR